MQILVDATSTQDQLKHHGIGEYTRRVIEHMAPLVASTQGAVGERKRPYLNLLLFDAPSTLDLGKLRATDTSMRTANLGDLKLTNYMDPWTFRTKFRPAIKRAIANSEPTVYFAPYFWRGTPTGILPTVTMIHDMALPRFNIYSEKSPLHNLIRKWQYKNALNKAGRSEKFITNSQFTKDEFIKYTNIPSEQVVPIHLGVDIRRKAVDISGKLPAGADQRGYIIYMGGTLAKNKNSEAVILAYWALRQKMKERTPFLVIAGRAFARPSRALKIFEHLTANLSLENDVHIVGGYLEEEKFSLLRNAKLFVHLSTYEGFGLAVAEAMAAGTPVVAHDGSSYRELVGDAGLLVDSSKPAEVADAMHRVLTDEDLRHRLTASGEVRASEFTWEKTSRLTLDVLMSVV